MKVKIQVKYIGSETMSDYEYSSLENQAIKRIEGIYNPMSGVSRAKIEFDLGLGGKKTLEYAPFVVDINWRDIETLLAMLLHMEYRLDAV